MNILETINGLPVEVNGKSYTLSHHEMVSGLFVDIRKLFYLYDDANMAHFGETFFCSHMEYFDKDEELESWFTDLNDLHDSLNMDIDVHVPEDIDVPKDVIESFWSPSEFKYSASDMIADIVHSLHKSIYIFDKDKVIGFIGITPETELVKLHKIYNGKLPDADKYYNIHYAISPEYRRKGIMKNVFSSLLSYISIFNTDSIEKTCLILVANADNMGSIDIIKRFSQTKRYQYDLAYKYTNKIDCEDSGEKLFVMERVISKSLMGTIFI